MTNSKNENKNYLAGKKVLLPQDYKNICHLCSRRTQGIEYSLQLPVGFHVTQKIKQRLKELRKLTPPSMQGLEELINIKYFAIS